MTTPMIERLVDAAINAAGHPTDDYWHNIVRAVLAEMREPTEAQIKAGQRAIGRVLQFIPNGQRNADGSYTVSAAEIKEFANECSRAAERCLAAMLDAIEAETGHD